jgi:hypothetical protein
VPDPLVLTGAQGLKSVTAVLVDDAGNESPGFSDVVTLDAVPPLDGVVVLADGATTVNTRTIPVTVSGTDADTMLVYEVGANAACGDPACADPRFLPLSSASTLTLSDGLGAKRVCWKFCDRAGNGSAVGQSTPNLTLGNYVSRPTPVIDAVVPQSVVALSDDVSAPITLVGRGIAANTQAQVGEFLLDCVSAGADACQPDLLGGCGLGGRCEATCAERCDLLLPAQLSRRAGTYVVRLVTPAPVVDGLGTSVDVAFLDVVAPLPIVTGMNPSGVVQNVVAGVAVGQTVTLDVRGTDFLDNVTFRLDQTYARVRSLTRDPANPRLTTARIEVSTANIAPDDLDDVDFTAVNPPPGGGGFQPLRFGINPPVTSCPLAGDCVSNLRRTRALLPSGRGRGQVFQPGPASGFGLLGGTGATAVSTRSRLGLSATRVPWAVGGGQAPLPWPGRGTIRLEDGRGTGPAVALTAATKRNDGTFDAPYPVPTGDNVRFVTAGDVNADGFADLVVYHRDENAMTVLLGVGDGTFTRGPHRQLRVVNGGLAFPPTFADLDGDGFLDLALSDGTVLMGRGDGTFDERWYFGPSVAVQVGDLNRDGAPDLVLGGQTRDVYIHLGIGDGSFRERIVMPIPPSGMSPIALGDFDGDDVPDLLGIYSAMQFLEGNGDGTFQAPVEIPQTLGGYVALGDLNLDGALDFVCKESNTANVLVRLGRGDGTFSVGASYVGSDGLQTMALAELDGDGYLDLVLQDHRAVTQLVHGNGDGSFGPTTMVLPGGLTPGARTVVDVDGDGALDVVSVNGNVNGELAVHRGGGREGSGGRLVPLAFLDASPGGSLAVRDLFGDGRMQVLSPFGGVSVVGMQANGAFGGLFGVPGSESDAATGRVNGDARPDIVSSSFQNSTVQVALQNANGTFAAPVTYPMPQPRTVESGDLNGDGRDDVVTLGPAGMAVRLANPDGTLGAQTAYAQADGTVVLADIDQDGDLDALFRGKHRLGAGNGTFGPEVASPIGGSVSMAVGDLDLDGDTDVAVCNGFMGSSTWLNPGNGQFVLGQRDAEGCGVVALGDLNGDGALDMLTQSDDSRDLRVHLNDGAGVFGPFAEYPMDAPATSVAVADLNGDGIAEVAISQALTHQLVIWETPAATPWTQVLTDLPAPRTPVAGAETRFSTHQAMQFIDRLAVRVRLEGANLQNLRIRLRAPDGAEIALDNGAAWANRAVWQAHYTTASVPLLATLHGWQPEGDWTLLVQGGNTAQAVLTDFAVITHGWFTREAP